MTAQLACQAIESDPAVQPSDAQPRWRLRVFDRCWPWRSTRREAIEDAVESRNARRCPDDHLIYLDAVASIQRDPPHPYDRWRMRVIRHYRGS